MRFPQSSIRNSSGPYLIYFGVYIPFLQTPLRLGSESTEKYNKSIHALEAFELGTPHFAVGVRVVHALVQERVAALRSTVCFLHRWVAELCVLARLTCKQEEVLG